MPEIPGFFKIRQHIQTPVVDDPAGQVREQFKTFRSQTTGRTSIAIALGSRGISSILPMVKALVEELQAVGVKPFVVAAMGSHGGGTEEGQLKILHGYGLTPENLGIPVLASPDVVEIPGASYGEPIMISRLAWESDGIIVVNRVKKHTDIQGDIESGLAKMIAVGLGNTLQAEKLHYGGIEYMSESIPLICADVAASGKLLFGLAVVENAHAGTAVVELIAPESMLEREKALLAYSKQISPRLPVDSLDVLIIDRGGKDVSGSCIETHIIGRMLLRGERELTHPNIKRIVLSDLTDKACGNAGGMGLADFITRRFFDKIDFKATYRNCISCYYSERGMIPLIMENDLEAITAAMHTSRNMDVSNPRMMRIENTLNLEYLYVTEAVYAELQDRDDIEMIAGPVDILTPNGALTAFFS